MVGKRIETTAPPVGHNATQSIIHSRGTPSGIVMKYGYGHGTAFQKFGLNEISNLVLIIWLVRFNPHSSYYSFMTFWV